jgi:hypothetical protein
MPQVAVSSGVAKCWNEMKEECVYIENWNYQEHERDVLMQTVENVDGICRIRF